MRTLQLSLVAVLLLAVSLVICVGEVSNSSKYSLITDTRLDPKRNGDNDDNDDCSCYGRPKRLTTRMGQFSVLDDKLLGKPHGMGINGPG